MIKYRIYSTYRTLHTVAKVDTVDEVINEIDKVIYKEDANYLVIKEDYENNTDIPFLSILSIEEWEQFKSEYYQENNDKVNLYGRYK